jgi:hypothetical protein
MRTGLITALVFIGLTFLVGMIYLFGGSGLGWLEYLLYSGIMFGWFHIWGDAYNNSVGEHLIQIGISLAINGAVGFAVGLCLHPLLRRSEEKRNVSLREIERQRRIAVFNQDYRYSYPAIALCSGFVFTVIFTPFFWESFGLAIALATLPTLWVVALLFRRKAHCPSCGQDWEIVPRSDNSILTWTQCPGCGLPLSREKANTKA